MTALRIVRADMDDLVVQVDPANGLELVYRLEGNWGHELDRLHLSFYDLERLEVVDTPVPEPQQGRFLRDGVWHSADGAPEAEPVVPVVPKRARRVATSEPKLRKPVRKA